MNNFLERIRKLKESGKILDVWSDGMNTEHEGILGDVMEFLYEIENKSQWAELYVQIFSWEYSSMHEGVITYYSNFYEVSPYERILSTAKSLKDLGYNEIYYTYIKGIYDYSHLKQSEYPKEWIDKNKEIDEWINSNIEKIFKCMLDLLCNIEELVDK